MRQIAPFALALPGPGGLSNGNCYEDNDYETFFWIIQQPDPPGCE